MGHFCRRLLLGLVVGQCLSWNVSQAVVVSTDASTSTSVEQTDNRETASSTSQSEAAASTELPVATESSAAEAEKDQADSTQEASRAIMFKEAVVATDSYGHELSTGKTVYSGETVKYQFRVDWQTGSAAIKELRFQFLSPNYVKFKSAKVTQANGDTSQLSVNSQRIEATLPGELNADNSWLTITVMATTKRGAETTLLTEGGEASLAHGWWLRHQIDLPTFMIIGLNPLEAALEQHTYHLPQNEPLVIKGKFWRESGLQTKQLKVWLMKDDNEMAKFFLDPVTAANGFEHSLDNLDLPVGRHELYLHAKDTHNLKIHPIKLTVTVQGELSFAEVAPQAKFCPTTVTGTQQAVTRHDDWRLKVRDTRDEDQSWRLMATATKLVDAENRPLAGDLIYHSNGQRVTLSARPQLLTTRQANLDQPIHDVVNGWSADQGILLETRADAVPGNYYGTITWQLEDVPTDQ